VRIAIGTNIFGEYPRQTLAMESLIILKDMSKNLGVEIDLYNVQFENNTIDAPGFKTLNVLKNSNITIRKEIIKSSGYYPDCNDCNGMDNTVPLSPKMLPLMNELFDAIGSLTEYDYVIFTNSDIMISNRLINEILETKKESYSVSRLEIQNINSLKDKIIPIKIEVAGFDTYVFKPTWWSENKHRFPKYLLGKPRWDNHYTSLFMTYSDGKILNYYPGHTLHIFHGYDAHQDDAETRYVNKLWDSQIGLQGGWGYYFEEILLHRSQHNGIGLSNKSESEDNITSKIFNITRTITDNLVNEVPSTYSNLDKFGWNRAGKEYIKKQIQ
jgi:hypothetical protein